jgi:uncharacterized protein
VFFSVSELELRKVQFATSFAPGQIDFLDERLRQRQPIEVRGSAELAEATAEIRVTGHIAGALEEDCDRCLEPVALPFDGNFQLSYLPAGEDVIGDEHELQSDDTSVGFYEGAGLELADVVREQVLLWLPMHCLCQPDCQGICPDCGQNRNQVNCGCRSERVDARWEALRKLRSGTSD